MNPDSHRPPEDVIQSAATTRYPSPIVEDSEQTLSDEEKISGIASHFHAIMQLLGLDMTNPSLSKTPERVAKLYVKEIFSGLQKRNFPEITLIEQETPQGQMVFVKAGFTSFCEHHFVPMVGTAYIAYLPADKVIGLSKIPRVLRYFSRRPQLQERLTAQVADALSQLIDTENIGIVVKACHYCVLARGVEDCHNETTTQTLMGEFNTDPQLRAEFLARTQ